MLTPLPRLALLVGLLQASCLPAAAPALVVSHEPAGGTLASGESATFTVQLPAGARDATFKLLRFGQAPIQAGPLATDPEGRARIQVSLDSPGSVLGVFEAKDSEGGRLSARGGFLFDPAAIRPAVERPSDFDAFWDGRLAELSGVPLDARIQHVDTNAPGVRLGRFSLSVSGTQRVRGQFARPDRPGRFPALVIYQWAGVYPLQDGWVTGRAGEGWLAVNVLPHDLDPALPAAEFDRLKEGDLKEYGAIGNEARETSYFLRMYLGTKRVLDWVRTLPEWDGRVLVTLGTSQGGTQALVAAALDPSVTAAIANVPALCDQNGLEAGRAIPFPYWLRKTAGKDAEAVGRAALYYDVAHFAPRIRSEVLVSAGLADETCPPAGIAAAFNLIPARDRKLLLMPGANHQGAGGTHEPFHRGSAELLRRLLESSPERAAPPAPKA